MVQFSNEAPEGPRPVKFTKIKSWFIARFSGISALGTPSNIRSRAISYSCAKFGAFVNSVMIVTLRDLTILATRKWQGRNRSKNSEEDISNEQGHSYGTTGLQEYSLPNKDKNTLLLKGYSPAAPEVSFL